MRLPPEKRGSAGMQNPAVLFLLYLKQDAMSRDLAKDVGNLLPDKRQPNAMCAAQEKNLTNPCFCRFFPLNQH